MNDKLTIFDYVFNNEELEEDFNNFFHRYALTPIFTNEHRAAGIRVTYVDARSVINPGGSYHNTLLELADYVNMAMDNKSYEEALFKIIYEAKSFQTMMNKIKKLLNFITTIDEDHMFNLWNIVWYNKEVY